MPEKTAANIFITNGLAGKPITPYKHSMYRPTLYIDIRDVCKAFKNYADKILNEDISRKTDSLSHIVNIYYPKPVTIFELAEIVRDVIIEKTGGKITPKIKIVDKGIEQLFSEEDKKRIRVNIKKAKEFLNI